MRDRLKSTAIKTARPGDESERYESGAERCVPDVVNANLRHFGLGDGDETQGELDEACQLVARMTAHQATRRLDERARALVWNPAKRRTPARKAIFEVLSEELERFAPRSVVMSLHEEQASALTSWTDLDSALLRAVASQLAAELASRMEHILIDVRHSDSP